MSTRTHQRDLGKSFTAARKKVRVTVKKKEFVSAILDTIREQEVTSGASLHTFEDIRDVWQANHRHQRMYNLITMGDKPGVIDHIVDEWEKAEGQTALNRLQRQNKVIEKVGGWHTIEWLREQVLAAQEAGDAIRVEEFRQLLEERRKELDSFAAGIIRHSSMLNIPTVSAGTLFLEAQVETEPGSDEYEAAEIIWEDNEDE